MVRWIYSPHTQDFKENLQYPAALPRRFFIFRILFLAQIAKKQENYENLEIWCQSLLSSVKRCQEVRLTIQTARAVGGINSHTPTPLLVPQVPPSPDSPRCISSPAKSPLPLGLSANRSAHPIHALSDDAPYSTPWRNCT